MKNIFNNFRLTHEEEGPAKVIDTIEKDVAFKGTNLWILVFAIFIASLGLNVNSTAVVIGAMLVSPLMGPIMGLGLGMGINDLALLRRALFNYLFAAGVGLATSAVYFLISPINDAHSEILSRTAPNIYDVLIAFFGGLAGIFATSSKQKGNVIPGVAIATALMPPLCTAGYGLATLQFSFFFGALYLFLINTVFIALATLLTVRFLRFPAKHLVDVKAETRAKWIAWGVVLITLIPSIYFGYDIVQQARFMKQANSFVDTEAVFPDDYLLKKSIDPKKQTIALTYGGKKIEPEQIDALKSKLRYYNIENADLQIQQGFAYLADQLELKNQTNEQLVQLSATLADKEEELKFTRIRLDSLNAAMAQTNAAKSELITEAKALYPQLTGLSYSLLIPADTTKKIDTTYIVYLRFSKLPLQTERRQMESWLQLKLQGKTKVIFGR